MTPDISTHAITLIRPDHAHLPGFVAALQAGWSPSTVTDVSAEQLAEVTADAHGFLAAMWTDAARPRLLPDGTETLWLPQRIFWMWDGAFCGSINLRFLPGTEDLPPHVSGHVGYTVVPWKQRRGYATFALQRVLPVARDIGLARVRVTCDPTNEGSRRVILAAGGKPAGHTHDGKLQFWISTT